MLCLNPGCYLCGFLRSCACMVQMWHLLNDQIRATEGFRLQGIQPIKDHMDLTLADLSIAPVAKGAPALKCRSLSHRRSAMPTQ